MKPNPSKDRAVYEEDDPSVWNEFTNLYFDSPIDIHIFKKIPKYMYLATGL
jgi:hypothetical protein